MTRRNQRFEHIWANMATPLKTLDGTPDIAAAMQAIGRRAKAAARVLALAPTEQKDRALAAMAKAIRADKTQILAANAEDVADGRAAGLAGAFLDRLTLNDQRVAAMADGIDTIRALKDPVGEVIAHGRGPTA